MVRPGGKANGSTRESWTGGPIDPAGSCPAEASYYAVQVARAKGETAIVCVQSRQAHEAGSAFYRANHHVWLAESIPPMYLALADEAGHLRNEDNIW
jgi:hypothetical protein